MEVLYLCSDYRTLQSTIAEGTELRLVNVK